MFHSVVQNFLMMTDLVSEVNPFLNFSSREKDVWLFVLLLINVIFLVIVKWNIAICIAVYVFLLLCAIYFQHPFREYLNKSRYEIL